MRFTLTLFQEHLGNREPATNYSKLAFSGRIFSTGKSCTETEGVQYTSGRYVGHDDVAEVRDGDEVDSRHSSSTRRGVS